MPDVFLSYARSDSSEFVERLTRELEARGKDPWVDRDDIPPASRWERDLHEGIAGSLVFAYVISPGSVASEHCRRELDHAREANKRIVPVAHREVPDAEIPAAVGQLNWIPQQGVFEDDFDTAIAKFIEALETDAEALRSHTRWQQRAVAWRDGNHARGLLATGAELREADRWLAEQTGRKPEPTPLQAEWVRAGRRLAARRQRLLFAGVVVALIVSAVLGVLALMARNDAVDQRKVARSGELASDAIANLETDPELSLILALEAARTSDNQRSEQVLRRALVASKVRARVESPMGVAIDSARFSPDGRLMATAVEDGSAQIADSRTGEILQTLETGAEFTSDVEFAPDGEGVVTADSDGNAILWSLDGTRERTISVTGAAIHAVAFSPDGSMIAVGAQSGYAAVMDTDGGGRREFPGLSGRVASVEFSPDSRMVLTASANDEGMDAGDGARLWSVKDGSPVRTMGSGAPANDAEFSPNGRGIAVAGLDGSASVFEAATGRRLGKPLQDSDTGAFITRVAFVPGGEQVITAGAGGAVTAWDLLTREPVDRYRGHNGYVLDVTVDREGQRLATAGGDGTARVWDLGIRSATASSAAIAEPEFDATGEEVMFADGLLRTVDATTGELVREFARDAPVFDAAYSPDSTLIATAEGDGSAAILDAQTGKPAGPVLDHGGRGGVSLVSWSRDGSRILTVGIESAAKVWDATSGELVAEIETDAPDGVIFAADLSVDGTELAVTEAGDAISIRRVADGSVLTMLEGHTGLVHSLEFDADGDRLLSASDDGTARIWDGDSGEELRAFFNDGNPIRAASWSDDGSLVATAGTNRQLRVWDVDSGLEILRQEGPDVNLDISSDLSRIAAVDNRSGQLTIYECDVCGATIERLEALAAERITREPTVQERELYLDR